MYTILSLKCSSAGGRTTLYIHTLAITSLTFSLLRSMYLILSNLFLLFSIKTELELTLTQQVSTL